MSNVEMLDRSVPPERGVTVISDEFTKTHRQGGRER